MGLGEVSWDDAHAVDVYMSWRAGHAVVAVG